MPLTDNTAKWGVRRLTKFQDNNGIPVGFEYFSTNPNVPAGSLPLFGGEYSRTVYADLWSWVQEQAGYLIEESEWQAKSVANEGNVPFYSTGDGTTTFRVPSLKCWVKGANGIEEVGSYLAAGLPNITGYLEVGKQGSFAEIGTDNMKNPTGGAFYTSDDSTTKNSTAYWTDLLTPRYNFNASRSSSIYGNSDTVQPKSIVGIWLVKAYGTVTNVGSTDVADIASGLTELETRCDAHIRVVETYNDGTNWYRRYSDGWLEQGGFVDTPSVTSKTISLVKPFSDTNYFFTGTVYSGAYGGGINEYLNTPRTTTSITLTFHGHDIEGRFYATVTKINWYACGQGA